MFGGKNKKKHTRRSEKLTKRGDYIKCLYATISNIITIAIIEPAKTYINKQLLFLLFVSSCNKVLFKLSSVRANLRMLFCSFSRSS